MRVYIPFTLPGLAAADAADRFAAPGTAAHAVTPAVREWYVEGDVEELEYVVATDAAQASLRLLAADPGAPRRRVVVAADVPDAAVTAGRTVRSSVVLQAVVPRSDVASVHLDEAGAEPVVAAAVEALEAADAGDDDAGFLLDEAEAADLLWYDVTEIGRLVDDGGA